MTVISFVESSGDVHIFSYVSMPIKERKEECEYMI